MKLKAMSILAGAAVIALSGVATAAPHDKDKPGKVGFEGKRMPPVAWRVLDERERKQLREAMAEVRDDPGVAAAREQLAEAHKAMRKAWNDALLKADPTLAPIIKKMKDTELPPRRGFDGKPGGRHKAPEQQAEE